MSNFAYDLSRERDSNIFADMPNSFLHDFQQSDHAAGSFHERGPRTISSQLRNMSERFQQQDHARFSEKEGVNHSNSRNKVYDDEESESKQDKLTPHHELNNLAFASAAIKIGSLRPPPPRNKNGSSLDLPLLLPHSKFVNQSIRNMSTRYYGHGVAKRVSEGDYRAFQAWKKSHPVVQPVMPSFEKTPWTHVSKPDVYLPHSFVMKHLTYHLLKQFPNASTDVMYHVGGFGVVAAYRCGNHIVVLKVSQLDPNADVHMEQEAFEILTYIQDTKKMEDTCGQRFINMIASGVSEITDRLRQSYIVLDKMDMSLYDLARSKQGLFEKNEFVCKHVFYSIVKGLHCMHSAKPLPIAHGDLKPENILCSPNTEAWLRELQNHQPGQPSSPALSNIIYVKMADFDASFTSVWSHGTTKSSYYSIYTEFFTSPERRYSGGVASIEDDVWALGMTFLSLLNPHKARKVHHLVQMYLQPKHTRSKNFPMDFDLQDKIDELVSKEWSTMRFETRDEESLASLLTVCLCVNPALRYTTADLLELPFFQF